MMITLKALRNGEEVRNMLKINLAAARVNRGMTQRAAAKELGISTKTLLNWEKGASFPNMQKIDEICALYGVSVDNLIFLPQNNA